MKSVSTAGAAAAPHVTAPTPPLQQGKLLVQGAGLAWVNGSYEEHGNIRNGKPQYLQVSIADQSVTKKDGTETHIYWRGPIKCWLVERTGKTSTESVYKNAENSATPPAAGWEVFKDSVAPAPTVTFLPHGS